MLVVDGDGHTVEPPKLWTERMDAERWGDLIPHWEREEGTFDAFVVGGVVRSGGKEGVDAVLEATGSTMEELAAANANLRLRGGSDPDARIVDMDGDGIDAAVLYPSHAMFWGPVDPIPALADVEFVLACQQAYNDWIVDYCAGHPGRLYGVGCVPLQDIDLALGEAQRIHDAGLKGVFLRPSAYIDELPLSHEVYDPFWQLCQDLGLTVAFHPGVHVDTPGACRKLGLVRIHENLTVVNSAVDQVHGGSGFGQAVGNAVDMIVTVGRLLMGGVCERFPDLTCVFLESAGGWMATMLERMDEQVGACALERRWLTMKPSEYFARQCYISFEPDEWNLAASAERLGTDRIIWASDYPHPEYHPGVVDEVRERVAGLSDPDQARILGLNAVEAYGLDPAAA